MTTGPTRSSEAAIDVRVEALLAPVIERPPLVDRLWDTGRQLVATPGRSALATLGVVAVVVAAGCTLPTTRSVQTAFGPARVRCGLDVFVYGQTDHTVTATCRAAEAARFGLFVPAVLAALALAAAGSWVVLPPHRRLSLMSALRRAPVRCSLLVTGALGAAVCAGALRPAEADIAGSGSLTVARCGADTYFSGFPDPTVLAACRHAYAGRAHVLEVALVVLGAGVVAGLHLLYTGARSRRGRKRVLLAGVAALILLSGAAAARPVTVRVGADQIASCGLDSLIAGYPDPSVQHACRAALRLRAAGGTAAATLVLVCAGIAEMVQERR